MNNLEDLKKRYEAITKEIQKRELQNEMRQKEIEKCREEVKALGFNPDNLDAEIELLQAKIDAEYNRLDKELAEVEKELGL